MQPNDFRGDDRALFRWAASPSESSESLFESSSESDDDDDVPAGQGSASSADDDIPASQPMPNDALFDSDSSEIAQLQLPGLQEERMLSPQPGLVMQPTPAVTPAPTQSLTPSSRRTPLQPGQLARTETATSISIHEDDDDDDDDDDAILVHSTQDYERSLVVDDLPKYQRGRTPPPRPPALRRVSPRPVPKPAPAPTSTLSAFQLNELTQAFNDEAAERMRRDPDLYSGITTESQLNPYEERLPGAHRTPYRTPARQSPPAPRQYIDPKARDIFGDRWFFPQSKRRPTIPSVLPQFAGTGTGMEEDISDFDDDDRVVSASSSSEESIEYVGRFLK